jgi:hypothetical protein
MMKRCVGTTSHTRIWVTKDISSQLINHARSRLPLEVEEEHQRLDLCHAPKFQILECD